VSIVDMSNSKPVSTIPDDVFYILKLILTRMLSSGNPDFVKTGLSEVKIVMEQHYVEIYRNKLDGTYIQEIHVNTRGEKEKESRLNFIVSIHSRSKTPL
jgi:conserved oligomeric Golgi complex subunit 4